MRDAITAPLIFARPESIEVMETYQYQVSIGMNSTCQLAQVVDNPAGIVRTEIPYDGFKALPVKSAQTLKEDLSAYDPDTPHQAVAGWLGISEPYDWLVGRREGDGLEFIEPVKIWLRSPLFHSPEDWVSDRFVCLNEHTYTPATPRYFPVNVDLKIWDSTSDHFAFHRRLADEVAKVRTSAEMIRLLGGDMLQGGVFVMDMDIQVLLPADLDPQNLTVQLSSLNLDWVSIPLPGEVSVFDWERSRKLEWCYQPDDSTIEVSNIPLSAQAPARGTNLRPYRASLSFIIKQASQVILQSEITGRLAVDVNGWLLSGRQVSWMDATGKRVQDLDKIHTQTRLAASFDVDLNHLFMNRQAVIYRQWMLPGVPLTPARLDDLAGALSDLGYELTLDEKPLMNLVEKQEADRPVFGRVSGSRWDVRPHLEPIQMTVDLWAVQIAQSQTEHEVTSSQGTVRTTLATSDLFISACGRSNCQGSVLAGDLDRLMVVLKSRLMSIATQR